MAEELASREHKKRRHGTSVPPIRGLLPLIGFLFLWQSLGSDTSPYYPRPSSWGVGLLSLWSQGVFIPATLTTFTTFAVSLGASTVLGALLGFSIGKCAIADRALSPTLEFFRTMPAAAIVPIAVLLLGYNQSMKIVVVTMATIWPIMLNTRSATRTIAPILLDVGASLHLSRWEFGRKIVLPSLLPALLLGVRVAAPIALIITLLVEIVTGVSGIGGLIATARDNFRSSQVFGLVALTGLFGLIVNAFVASFGGYIFRYRPDRQ